MPLPFPPVWPAAAAGLSIYLVLCSPLWGCDAPAAPVRADTADGVSFGLLMT